MPESPEESIQITAKDLIEAFKDPQFVESLKVSVWPEIRKPRKRKPKSDK